MSDGYCEHCNQRIPMHDRTCNWPRREPETPPQVEEAIEAFWKEAYRVSPRLWQSLKPSLDAIIAAVSAQREPETPSTVKAIRAEMISEIRKFAELTDMTHEVTEPHIEWLTEQIDAIIAALPSAETPEK